MQNNAIQHLLETLELSFSHEWKALPSRPSDADHHSFLVAIDPTKKLLTDDLKLTSAVTIGTYKITHQLIDMVQNDNLQVGYLSVKDKDKVVCHEKLSHAIRMILIDSVKEYQAFTEIGINSI